MHAQQVSRGALLCQYVLVHARPIHDSLCSVCLRARPIRDHIIKCVSLILSTLDISKEGMHSAEKALHASAANIMQHSSRAAGALGARYIVHVWTVRFSLPDAACKGDEGAWADHRGAGVAHLWLWTAR